MEQEKLMFTVNKDPKWILSDLRSFIENIQIQRGVVIAQAYLSERVFRNLWEGENDHVPKDNISITDLTFCRINARIVENICKIDVNPSLPRNQMLLVSEVEKNTNQYYTFIVETKEEN